MGLTQISTAGVKDDAVTSGKIPADAIGSSEIAANAVGSSELADNAVDTAAIASGAVTTNKIADNQITSAKIVDTAVTLAKLEHGTSSNNGKFLRANNGADPTFETVNTDLVSDSSPQLGGDLDLNGNDITGGGNLDLTDSGVVKLGTGDDLQIYHNGSGSFIDVYTNDFQIRNETSEVMAAFYRNGNVRLYNDGLKQVETFHSSTVGHSPSGGSDITGGGIKTTRTSSHNSNIGYYCYKDSNLVARLTNHGSGPEGILQLYNQGVPKLSMNGTNGTITLHGTAGFIQFGDTNSSSHQLDDYEEGTWTPQVHDGTISYQNAQYTKIGRQVTVVARIYNFSNNSTNDAVRIKNLPFNAAVQDVAAGSVMYSYGGNSHYTTLYMNSVSGGQLNIYGGHSGAFDQLRHNELSVSSGSTDMYIVATYFAAT